MRRKLRESSAVSVRSRELKVRGLRTTGNIYEMQEKMCLSHREFLDWIIKTTVERRFLSLQLSDEVTCDNRL